MSNAGYGAAVHTAISALIQAAGRAADAIASEFNRSNADTLGAILAGISAQCDEHIPSVLDARSARWRCRFRIYLGSDTKDPVADSDDELPPDAPGSMVITGLPAVGSEAAALARAFHKTHNLQGMSREDTERAIRGFRPTLSRRKGNGVLRLYYDTVDTFNANELKRGWLMRVDIARETTKGTES